MDNLTHTFFGLTVAKSGLERATPLATTTLLIASNMPDVDSVMRFRGAFVDLENHRGFTHSFVGLLLLSALLTLILVFLDRRFRLRHDMFRRPIRPLRIFALAYFAGLCHLLMDFTNNYGVRPFLPFSGKWFYGDLIVVVDPWIWLVLGGAAMWLTINGGARIAVWVILGIIMALLVAFALQQPSDRFPAIPLVIRLIWFSGLALVIFGAIRGWGQAGEKVARSALIILLVYWGGMWLAKQTALDQARSALPAENITALSVWPTPANPLLWQAVAANGDTIYSTYINISNAQPVWQEAPVLDARLVEALKNSPRTRYFMKFARYTVSNVEALPDGYAVTLRDVRFDLKMSATLDENLVVKTAELKWF
ncbi:MAG: metal-dependent hydrolase [Acidobacteria bacterium]|nr:metal-dependent hydrolase [Acidobacteriota bacterium]